MTEEEFHIQVAALFNIILDDKVMYQTVENSNQIGMFSGYPNEPDWRRKARAWIKNIAFGLQKKLKAKGVKKGFPDIILFYKSKAFCIELKSKTGTLSVEQKIMHFELDKVGVPTIVAKDIPTILKALERWEIPHKKVIV